MRAEERDWTIHNIKRAAKILKRNGSAQTHRIALDAFAKSNGFKDHKSLMWIYGKEPNSPLISKALEAANEMILEQKEERES